MNKAVSLFKALCLPAPEIEALLRGQTIAIYPRQFLNQGDQFFLYPTDCSTLPLPSEQFYRPIFDRTVQQAIQKLELGDRQIKAWAVCQGCQGFDGTSPLHQLSQSTIWTTEGLQAIVQRQQSFFLAYLRVYTLDHPLNSEVDLDSITEKQVRKFIGLNGSGITQSPVLTEGQFNKQLQRVSRLEAPEHPEIEELQALLATKSDPAVKKLEAQIYQFLGWSNLKLTEKMNRDLDWINEIANLGNRSKETEGTTAIAAGTAFENVVKQSLDFLGFNVDHFHKGGAGGVDVFCSAPYPLVIECKSGKKIPNDTAVQLLNLATLKLGNADLIKQSAKLIIGPGEPTPQLKSAAQVHGMSILNPETLENLVKLQGQYPNSIDLFELKKYLKPGYSNDSVEDYIEQVRKKIKLRSHIIQVVKDYLHITKEESASLSELKAVYLNSNPSYPLSKEELQYILIELSSPLTGYLGRVKGKDGKDDRFYFLRDLVVE